MSKDWLKGASGNSTQFGRNMSLHIWSTPFGGEENKVDGPSVSLILNPKTLPRVHLKNPVAAKYGLEIGLPIGLVALGLIVLGICCGIKKNNKHHRSIRGVSKDYMAKRARRKGGGGDIALDDIGEEYQDQPVRGGTGNVFRDEVAKQREEDNASLRRHPSSY